MKLHKSAFNHSCVVSIIGIYTYLVSVVILELKLLENSFGKFWSQWGYFALGHF